MCVDDLTQVYYQSMCCLASFARRTDWPINIFTILFDMKVLQYCQFHQDLHMVELEDFKYGGTNITAFRLVDPNDELVQVQMTTHI